MPQINRDAKLERVENPEPDTEERREAAETIDALWRTDATLTDMAEESGFSRQHIVNVLDSHFMLIEPEETQEETIEVPRSVLDDPEKREAWLRGYETGYSIKKAT
jgi:hypothetical protein